MLKNILKFSLQNYQKNFKYLFTYSFINVTFLVLQVVFFYTKNIFIIATGTVFVEIGVFLTEFKLAHILNQNKYLSINRIWGFLKAKIHAIYTAALYNYILLIIPLILTCFGIIYALIGLFTIWMVGFAKVSLVIPIASQNVPSAQPVEEAMEKAEGRLGMITIILIPYYIANAWRLLLMDSGYMNLTLNHLSIVVIWLLIVLVLYPISFIALNTIIKMENLNAP